MADPTEPSDANEPIDPIESTEPFDAIERMESSDHNDHKELSVTRPVSQAELGRRAAHRLTI
jgi:hypothetical protein